MSKCVNIRKTFQLQRQQQNVGRNTIIVIVMMMTMPANFCVRLLRMVIFGIMLHYQHTNQLWAFNFGWFSSVCIMSLCLKFKWQSVNGVIQLYKWEHYILKCMVIFTDCKTQFVKIPITDIVKLKISLFSLKPFLDSCN